MEHMKIAQVVTSLSYGGAERQLLTLCAGLKQHGFHVVVGSMKSGGELVDHFRSKEIPVRELGMHGGLDLAVFFRIRDWLQNEHPQIVHTHLFKADIYGGWAAASLGIPFVCTKHNEDQYLKNFFFRWIAGLTAKRSRRVIAVSNAVRNFLVEVAAMKRSNIDVIPLGIVPINVNRDPHTAELIRFGVVARLSKQKGHSFLLQAWKAAIDIYPMIRLSIFGSGELEEELKELSKKLNIEDSVEFRGTVLDQEEIYKDMDVLVLPSLWEGAGLALLEAMSLKIPVITSGVGGVTEYAVAECALLVPPASVDALRDAILQMARDPGLRNRLGESGSNRARLFDFQDTLAKHVSLYEEITSG